MISTTPLSDQHDFPQTVHPLLLGPLLNPRTDRSDRRNYRAMDDKGG